VSRGKIFVVYDRNGTIKATSATFSPDARVAGAPGRNVLELDDPGLEQAEMTRYLQDLHTNHCVDITGAPRIVRKTQGESGHVQRP
jgi:hypothetical protein